MENIIKKLTEQHPEGVAQLLKAYGYDAEPNAKNLRNLVKVHGNDAFPFSSYTEDQKKPKRSLFETLNSGLDVALKSLQIFAPKKYSLSPGGFNPVNNQQMQPVDQTDRILGMSKTLFYVLAALIIISFGIILFKKKN
jgi:hypothetical protein